MAEAHTTLLYQTDGHLTHHTSKLVSLQRVKSLPDADQALVKNATDEDFALVTDATIFYVQGGGQPSDTGTIVLLPDQGREEEARIFEVHAARHPADGHAVLHFGRFNPAPVSVPTGTRLKQSIDIPKRELHSRLHTAGHILGLAINALSAEGVLAKLVESKASHYPDSAAVEFIGSIGNESKGAIQKMTDELVAGASRVLIHNWPLERVLKECKGCEGGFVLPDGEAMARVVEVEGWGAYPCGGTHVEDCAKVGKIEVKKISRSKGVSRVSYRVL